MTDPTIGVEEAAARAPREPLEPALVEALAAYAHEAWSGWMRYLFSKCHLDQLGDEAPTAIIPAVWYERWLRQVNMPYAELREDERESDRKEARRMLEIVRAALPRVPEPDLKVCPHCVRGIAVRRSGPFHCQFCGGTGQMAAGCEPCGIDCEHVRAARAGAEAPRLTTKNDEDNDVSRRPPSDG